MNPAQPYNDLPRLPPQADLETPRILRACLRARVALAEMRGAGDLIPNQSILLNTIPILEAQASTAIENIVTTADRMFRFATALRVTEPDGPTREALRYREALQAGVALIAQRPLSTATATAICRTIKGLDLDIRRVPGVAIVNQASGERIYTPPEGEALIRNLLSNWEHYIHDPADPDPLIRMAVMHYQFEAIHPFADGNGRTGRVLIALFLIERGLLSQPVLFLSRYLIQHREAYYRLLLRVTTEAAWEDWIVFMLSGVEETARWTTARIDAIRVLIDRTRSMIAERAPRLLRADLIDLVFSQPYCRIGNLVDGGIAKRQAAASYLKQLCTIGVLEERRQGREKLFVNPALHRLLTEG